MIRRRRLVVICIRVVVIRGILYVAAFVRVVRVILLFLLRSRHPERGWLTQDVRRNVSVSPERGLFEQISHQHALFFRHHVSSIRSSRSRGSRVCSRRRHRRWERRRFRHFCAEGSAKILKETKIFRSNNELFICKVIVYVDQL